ncbi:MAG: hypothetical protein M1817_005903 [Caeruleum heppii]|nr:MAG: hypothetical protein M1817_005903 [Caeruleum heppii]
MWLCYEFRYNPSQNSSSLPATHPVEMQTMPPPSRLRSLYRALLRELPSAPKPLTSSASPGLLTTNTSSPPPPRSQSIHAHLRRTFSPPGTQQRTRPEEAEEVLAYLRAQRTYLSLLERYNPGMDLSEEERVRLSARRVGMNLPVQGER